MASAFIYPTVSHLMPGYDCIVSLPTSELQSRLIGAGTIILRYRVFRGGVMLEEKINTIEVGEGKTLHLADYVWNGAGRNDGDASSYLETDIRSVNEQPIFNAKEPLSFYAIYSKPGAKSFFSDNAYKYGSPPVIGQIAAFGCYLDCYNPVHIDRDHDAGQTLALINPYNRPVLVRVQSYDGRHLPRIKVQPQSAHRISLSALLREDEHSWVGQIQISATNRLIVYAIMNSLRDPLLVNDHEHLDPFRSDPTHLPWFRIFREKLLLRFRAVRMALRSYST